MCDPEDIILDDPIMTNPIKVVSSWLAQIQKKKCVEFPSDDARSNNNRSKKSPIKGGMELRSLI